MANMQMTKTPMPEQDANVRNHNFKEVTLGYTAEMAVNEAKRCLQCKKPQCTQGCPVNIRIPEFIAKVAEGDFAAAYEIITSTNALPALSGRVCPQETQCESKCVRGVKGEPVAIGRLERFVADWYRENVNAMPEKAESNGIKVAVVGSGPSGLTCASELAKKGYQVSIFEALHTAGGVLVYGIPEFRLPKVFTKPSGGLRNKLGSPDLMIFFTNTMSHKMVQGALSEIKGQNTIIERCHTSSLSALRGILDKYTVEG